MKSAFVPAHNSQKTVTQPEPLNGLPDEAKPSPAQAQGLFHIGFQAVFHLMV